MAYSYKGSINFGLVYIPVKLEKCVRPREIAFNQLDRNTMSRIVYKKSCRECDGREVDNKDIVKGYRYEGDRYVLMEDADFEKIKTKKDKSIIIERFVQLDEIDPVYYDTSYYVVPTGGEKAYALLRHVLEKENKVGIAKSVLGQKERLLALRVHGGAMILNALHFYAEIRKNPVSETQEALNKAEIDMAKLLLDGMTDSFEPMRYKDEYAARVMEAIEAKIAGKEITAPKESAVKITDLMEALRASVEAYS
ncbi:MAG: Ku protein [Firmicutes bacterium]|nr:Ku protein [Bacillota bacterium]